MTNILETDSTSMKGWYKNNNLEKDSEYVENVLSICSDMSNLKISSSEDEAVPVSDKCDVCDLVFTSQVHAKQHFEGRNHQKKSQSQPKAILSNTAPENHFVDCPTSINLSVNNEYKCDVCNVPLTSEVTAKQHFEGKKHQKNAQIHSKAAVSNSPLDDYFQDIHTQDDMPVINQDKCELCDVKFTSFTHASDHLKGKVHMKNFKTVSALKKNIKLECDTCGVVFSGIVDAEAHFNGRKHQRAIENRTSLPKLIADSISPLKPSPIAAENYEAVDKCKICDVVFTSKIIAKQHFEGKKHLKKAHEEFINSNAAPEISTGSFTPTDISSKNQHKCDVCNITFTSVAQATEHLKGKNHLKNARLKTISNDSSHHSDDKEFNINDNCNKTYLKNI